MWLTVGPGPMRRPLSAWQGGVVGADLDVDWDAEGRAVFDSWRVLMYARSIGNASVDQESLRQAASELATIVAIGPDTSTWPDRRYDLTLGGA